MKLNIHALFFKNTTIRQTVFKNTFWLTIAEVVSRCLQFFVMIYIIRVLGAAEFGKFSFAFGFVSIFAVFSNFGLASITIREFSQNKEHESKYPAILSLKIILSGVALLAMLVGSFFITQAGDVRRIIWILSCFILINDFFIILYAFLRGRHKMEGEAFIKIGQALITTCLVFSIILNSPSIENVGGGYLVANIMSLLLALVFFHKWVHSLSLDWNKTLWKKFLGMSWLLGFSAVFGVVFTSLDLVMMGYFGQITQVGWYGAAKQITTAVVIPTALILASFFPLLSRFFRESQEKLHLVWSYYVELMVLLAFPLVVGGIILAPKIIRFLYGSDYMPAVFAFKILILVAGVGFLYDPPYSLLIASHQQKKVFWITLAGAVINIALNVVLIPMFSLNGAAVALLATYVILLILLMTASNSIISIFPLGNKFKKILGISFLSSALMGVAIVCPLIYNAHIAISVSIGVICYFSVAYVLHIVTDTFFLKP